MRKHLIYFKRITAFALAVMLTLGNFTDYIPVQASTSQAVRPGSSSVFGGSYNPNVPGTDTYPMGYFMALTPITNSVNANTVVNATNKMTSSSWAVEGYVGREESALAIPSLNQSSLIFVPESAWSATTHNEATGKDVHIAIWNGFDSWMNSQYAVFGRTGNTTSGSSSNYVLFCNSSNEDKSTVKNIIWSNMDTSKSNHEKESSLSYSLTGVYADAIFKSNEVKSKDGTFYDFSKFMGGMTLEEAKSYIKKIVDNNSSLTGKAEKQLSYITNVTKENGTITYNGGVTIDSILANTYNKYIASSLSALGGDKYLLNVASDGKYDTQGNTEYSEHERFLFSEEGSSAEGVNPEYAYCSNVYNIGTLDLLICGYATARTHGGEAANYWLNAAAKYISQDAGYDSGIRIAVQPGIIMCGSDKDSKQRCVFASCNDLVNQAFGLYNASDDLTKAELANVASSISKPYTGYSGTNTIVSDSLAAQSKKILSGTSYNAESKMSIYSSYYTRLQSAITSAGKNSSSHKLEAVSGTHFWSRTAINRILKKWYKYDNGTTSEVSSTNNSTFVELVKSARLGKNVDPYNTSVLDSYGNAYIVGHSFTESSRDYDFALKLEVSSKLANGGKMKAPTSPKNMDDTEEGTDYFKAKNKQIYGTTEFYSQYSAKNEEVAALVDNTKKVKIEKGKTEKTYDDTVKLQLSMATNISDKSTYYSSLEEFVNRYAKDENAKNNIKVSITYNTQATVLDNKASSDSAKYTTTSIYTNNDKKKIKKYTSITTESSTHSLKWLSKCEDGTSYLQTITDTVWGKSHAIVARKKSSGSDTVGEIIAYQAVVTISFAGKNGEEVTRSAVSNWAIVNYGGKAKTTGTSLAAKLEIKDSTTGNSTSLSGIKDSNGYVGPNYELVDDENLFTDKNGEIWGSDTANADASTVANAANIELSESQKRTDNIYLRLRIASNPDQGTLKQMLLDNANEKKGFKITVKYDWKRDKNSIDTSKVSDFTKNSSLSYSKTTSITRDELVKMADTTGTGKVNVHNQKDISLAKNGIKVSAGQEISYKAEVTIEYIDIITGRKIITANSNWATVSFGSASEKQYRVYARLGVKSQNADKSLSKSGVLGGNDYIFPDYSNIKTKNYIKVNGESYGNSTANGSTKTYADAGIYQTSAGEISDTVRLKLQMQTVSGTSYTNIAQYLASKKLSNSAIKVKVVYTDKSTKNAKKAMNASTITGIEAGSFTSVSLADYVKYAERTSKSSLNVVSDAVKLTLGAKATASRKYQATISIKIGDETIKVKSNIAGITYMTDNVAPKFYEYPNDTASTLDTTDAYSELKEGNIYAETFDAMCGVPSTRSLYFASGASEFIVSLQAEYDADNIATRTYKSVFNGNVDCEYKENDQQKTMTAGSTVTTTLKADKNDTTTNTSATVGKNSMINPVGADSYNTTINGHKSGSTISASWSGTITNNTAKPSEDEFDKGTKGPICIGDNYKVGNGATGTVHEASPNWDVTQYNTDLQNAIDWVKALEKQSDNEDNGNVYYIADSDGVKRIYHVGRANIEISMSGSVTHAIECGTRPSYSKNGTYSSSNVSSAKLSSDEKSVLGSGYSYTHGTNATGSFSQNATCNVTYSGAGEQNCTIKTDNWTLTCPKVEHAHGGKGSDCYPKIKDEPVYATTPQCGITSKKHTHGGQGSSCYPQTGTKPIYASSPKCGLTPHKHASAPSTPSTLSSTTAGDGCTFSGGDHQHNHTHSFTYGTKWTDGKDSNVTYSIRVTFDGGYTTAKNYDGNGTLTMEKKNVGSSLPACALCGTCHEHVLPGITDMWSQKLPFDTIRITNLRIWKLHDGYVEGMTEIQQGDGYTKDDYDVVVSNITSGDPNVFYNVAAANSFGASDNTSKAGRIRYSLQRGQDDDVTWEEFTTSGTGSESGSISGLKRTNKCDGQSGRGTNAGVTVGSYAAKNPATTTKYGHERSWAKGCLYTRSKKSTTLDIHKKADAEKKKTNYSDCVDTVDTKSYEWKRFDARRNTPISATVISDFVILQTTGGDQSVMYYEDTVSTRSKTTIDKTKKKEDKSLQLKLATDDYVSGVSAYSANAATTQTDFAYKNENGGLLYHNHDNCIKYEASMEEDYKDYVDYSGGWTRMWESNALVNPSLNVTLSGYNGQYWNTSGKYNSTGAGAIIGTTFDNDATYFNGATTEEIDNGCKGRVTHRGLSGGNNDYSAPGFGQTRNGRSAGKIQMVKAGITQNPANPNGLYMPGQSYVFWRQIIEYNATKDYKDQALDGENAWSFEYDLSSNTNTTLNKYDLSLSNHYGYTQQSGYTDGQSICNSIVVQDPVSTEGARVIQTFDDSYDQRIDATDLAALTNESISDVSETCPGTSEDCAFRPSADLTCTYAIPSQKAYYTIDKYYKALYSYASEGSTDDADYGLYIPNSVASGYDNYTSVDIKGSGFYIDGDSNNYWLRSTENASLLLPWTDMGVDSSNTLEKYRISANITLCSSNDTALFTVGDFFVYTTVSNGKHKIHVKVDDYDSVFSTTIATGTSTNISIVLCAGDPTGTKVYVNDTEDSKSTSGTVPSGVSYGTGVYVGNGAGTSYSTDYGMDNIGITREAGTTSHVDACYITITKHYTTEDHTCNASCVTEKVLNCQEPHHTGSHYDVDNPICWKSCLEYNINKYGYEEGTKKSNDTHSAGGQTITVKKDGKATELSKASFILLDNYFEVYFPSSGNFYESNDHGVLYPSQTRGIGYTANMSTAEWTREKWICLPCPVIYNNNGTWEEHEANEWFRLSIYDANGNPNDYYQFYNLLRGGEVSLGEVQFAVEAINDPVSPAINQGYTFSGISDNWRSGNKKAVYLMDNEIQIDCPMEAGWSANRKRFDDFTSYHSAYTYQYIDIIGRIGNLLIDDTDDLRFSNLFKKSTWIDNDPDNDGYYIDGIVETVNTALQNTYLSWYRKDGSFGVRDVRGVTVSPDNEYYNTYGTLAWTNVTNAANTADHIDSIPVSASKNNISSLKDKELKLGYDILWDITTIGNYEQGSLQVKPYYYILDTVDGKLYPADMYMGEGNDTKALNLFGLYNLISNTTKMYVAYKTADDESVKVCLTENVPVGATCISYFEDITKANNFANMYNSLYDLPVYLNWSQEKERRNYSTAEETVTKGVAANVPYFVRDADGNILTYEEKHTTADGITMTQTYPVTKSLTIPYGTYYRLGNYQLLYSGARSRTFIGSSTITALHNAINGGNNTELNSEISQATFGVKAQRWHEKVGAPTSATFVAYIDRDGDGSADHIDPNEIITYINGETGYAKDEFTDEEDDGRYVALLTIDITAIGDLYNLHYEQGEDNGSFTVNGKTFQFGSSIPTLIGIYGLGKESTNTIDIDTMQSH